MEPGGDLSGCGERHFGRYFKKADFPPIGGDAPTIHQGDLKRIDAEVVCCSETELPENILTGLHQDRSTQSHRPIGM